MKSRGYIVAIDGPAGAGKSTVSQRLAKKLEGHLLDTGAMYRAVAYHSVQNELEDEKEISRLARNLRFSLDRTGKRVLINGQDLGRKLRTQRMSALASKLSKIKGVRDALTKKQRQLGKELSKRMPVVVEGRDIGTVVFPNVPYKFFITASESERARRRFKQQKAAGSKVSYHDVLKGQRHRDRQDSRRAHAPLRRAKGSVKIDTSKMNISQVVSTMREHILSEF